MTFFFEEPNTELYSATFKDERILNAMFFIADTQSFKKKSAAKTNPSLPSAIGPMSPPALCSAGYFPLFHAQVKISCPGQARGSSL